MTKEAIFEFACRLLAVCSHTDHQAVEKALSLIQSDKAYRKNTLTKKSGGVRIIHEPCAELKAIQSGLKKFFYRWPVDERMYGSVPQKSVADSANFHLVIKSKNKIHAIVMPRWTLRLDLKDAFPSVTSTVLRNLYRKLLKPNKLIGYRGLDVSAAMEVYEEFIRLLLLLTTYQDRLPQGAPTSPYLLNLVLTSTGVIDRIAAVCKERDKNKDWNKRLKFNVYVDDIVISSLKDKISDRFVNELIVAIELDGIFKVNTRKTCRNSVKYKAHLVNGIVLTSDQSKPKLTLPQKDLNSLRGKIHRLRLVLEKYRLALEDNDDKTVLLKDFLDLRELELVIGRINWLKSVCQKSNSPLPSLIKKEIELFTQTMSQIKKLKRTLYNRQFKALQDFLRNSFNRNH
jgi:RNA-directed DNA polymerase